MKTLSFPKTAMAIALCSFYACAPVYLPNTVNTPLLTKRHDTRLAVYASPATGYDAQTAYAVTNHIGVMFNGSYRNKRPTYQYSDYNRNYLFEGAIGYFKAVKKQRFEIYAGYGFGQNDSRFRNINSGAPHDSYLDNSTITTANIKKAFLQATLGTAYRNFEIAATTRYTFINIDDFYKADDVQGFFIEPVTTLKIGLKHLKIVSKAGFSIGGYLTDVRYDHQPLILSAGLEVSIGAPKKTPSTTTPVSF